ncbi:mevalonate kinase [Patescibacteria group bacterium]|nr:mevalonate kinase [Patescibacteria group bacterium]
MKTGRGKPLMIKFSAPGKIHLLGEHVVVYGKPALLTTVNLRATITLDPCHSGNPEQSRIRLQNLDSGRALLVPIVSGSRFVGARMTKVIEPIVKKHLKIKAIPSYKLTISSQIPTGCGLGSSAAISAAYLAALLTFLKVKWDLSLINQLTYQAEKVFHGNPSGADNAASIFGGLIWYRKEAEELKLIQKLPYSIPSKLARNFILINTGKPKETTKEMVESVSLKFKVQSAKFKRILDMQEQLVKELLLAIQTSSGNQLIQIIRAGEKNLERIGVVSPSVKKIIRKIETSGGAAKICGGGGKTGSTGILLCYHPKPKVIQDIAKSLKLDYFKTALGVKGLKQE